MKILNITDKGNYLVSMSEEDIKLITGRKFYRDDFKRMISDESDIDLSKFNALPADYDLNHVNRAIKDLESAITFLNNKKDSLNYLNKLKKEIR